MADTNTLSAEPRTDLGSRPSGRIRRTGMVPSVVYGLNEDAEAITVSARELSRILGGASGSNTVITLELDGKNVLTLARQIQRHPTRGDLVHVDFIRVSANVAVAAEVPLHLTGESVGVLDGGLLEQLVFTLSIEALPADIPAAIEHDISALIVGDQIHVRDLVLPRGVVTTQDGEELAAQVVAPRGVDIGEAEAAAEAAAEAGESAEGDGGESAGE
jgi:large subunit ribosomal protein L25